MFLCGAKSTLFRNAPATFCSCLERARPSVAQEVCFQTEPPGRVSIGLEPEQTVLDCLSLVTQVLPKQQTGTSIDLRKLRHGEAPTAAAERERIDPSRCARLTIMSKCSRSLKSSIPTLVVILAILAAASTLGLAADEPAAHPQIATPDSDLYIKVLLDNPVKLSKLKPGDAVEGSLSRDVYSADSLLFPAASRVHLTVDHLEKRRRPPDDHWPWVVKVFTPRHQAYPIFTSATVIQGANAIPLKVSLISETRLREVRAQAKKDKPGQVSTKDPGAVEVSPTSVSKKVPAPTLVLEASILGNSSAIDQVTSAAANSPNSESSSSEPATIPAATRCKILLLGDVSASKSMPGDAVRARLLEPVLLNSRVVLPAGTWIDGKVVKKTPPRMLSRAGSLYLTFTEMTLPGGSPIPISASLAGAELDRRSHTRIDSEGRLRGERPGKVWMAINIGVTSGIAKEADDTLQLIIEAFVSTATDASTAGVGRIAASCASAIYMATRHGRDVVIPRFTEMDISLDRAVSLGRAGDATPAAGGK